MTDLSYFMQNTIFLFLILEIKVWGILDPPVVHIGLWVSKQVEEGGILNHWPNTQQQIIVLLVATICLHFYCQILADRFVLNLKIEKTQRAIFPIDIGHEVRRNCLAPWSASHMC